MSLRPVRTTWKAQGHHYENISKSPKCRLSPLTTSLDRRCGVLLVAHWLSCLIQFTLSSRHIPIFNRIFTPPSLMVVLGPLAQFCALLSHKGNDSSRYFSKPEMALSFQSLKYPLPSMPPTDCPAAQPCWPSGNHGWHFHPCRDRSLRPPFCTWVRIWATSC